MKDKPRFLLIDDNHQFGSEVLSVFQNRYQIDFAPTMRKAKNRFSRYHYDLVLLDLYLEGHKDGLNFISFAKEKRRNIIIVTITGDNKISTMYETQKKFGVHLHLKKSEGNYEEWAEVFDKLLVDNDLKRPRIFLSHSSKEGDFAKLLKKKMEIAGAVVWLDKIEMRGGDKLPVRISNEIRQSNTLCRTTLQKRRSIQLGRLGNRRSSERTNHQGQGKFQNHSHSLRELYETCPSWQP